MAQNGAAHDGQVRVGAHKIVGELPDEVQLLAEGGPVDLHGHVLPVEHDAVLVIVHIGGVLEKPILLIDGNGNDAVVLTGGMVHPAGVALVLPAQQALGIAALGRQLGGGDGLGVLFRLGEVDGDVQIAVGGGGHPLHILHDAVAADVVRVLAEFVVPVRGGLRGLAVLVPEHREDLGGPGRQDAHELRIQQVPAGDAAVDAALGLRPVQNAGQDLLQGPFRGNTLLPGVQAQDLQQAVHRPGEIGRLDQTRLQGVARQVRDILMDHGVFLLFTPDGRRPRAGWSPRGSCPGPARPPSSP